MPMREPVRENNKNKNGEGGIRTLGTLSGTAL